MVKPLKNIFLACTVRWSICWNVFRILLFYLDSLGLLHAFQSFISSVVFSIILQLVLKCLPRVRGRHCNSEASVSFYFFEFVQCMFCSLSWFVKSCSNIDNLHIVFMNKTWTFLFLDFLILLKITNLITAEAIFVPVIQFGPSQ